MTDEALWEEFHRVVNMSSRELADWLRTNASQPDTEELPDQAGPAVGQQVLHILGKRKTDLTPQDEHVMRAVVDQVQALHSADRTPTAGDTGWRHRLMNVGHDPLRSS